MSASARSEPVGQTSHGQILKSTLTVGTASAVGVIFSIARNKAVALMLGPEGIGLMGLYGALADMAQNLAGLGVQSSGVRQIADAAGTQDNDIVARTARVLSRISVVLGLAGALLLILLAVPISGLTFGNHQHAGGVALLAFAVTLRVVSGGQLALLQGLRKVSSVATINVAGALIAAIATIPLVYVFGLNGIVPSIIAASAATLLSSWYFCRRIDLPRVHVAPADFGEESLRLLKLGFVFMVSGLLTFGAAYAIRLIVLHEEGVASAGLYQAAWAVGGLYIGIILQAMGTDFYPRLTAASRNNSECNRLVNEQAQMSLLLAGPGVIATLTFAPLVLQILYSHAFDDASDLLRLICLGMLLRSLAWPLGYIVVAKEANSLFFWTEVAATVVHVGLAWILVAQFGSAGAGAAFVGLYLWHSVIIYLVVRRASGFRWSRDNALLAPTYIMACVGVFFATHLLPVLQSTLFGSAVLLLSMTYSIKKLVYLLRKST